MADPRLFNRVCKITAWKEPTAIGNLPPSFFNILGNATEITDFRVQFSIEKNLAKEPNKSTVTITNLAESSRIALCKKPLHIRIDAGYSDTGARSLFFGDLTFGASTFKVPDWETKIQVGDGARAYGFAHSSKSFKGGVQVLEVIRYAAGTMSLQLPPDVEQSTDLKSALATGISLHGPTRDVLTRLLAPYGLHWSVQNGKLQIISDGALASNQAILIDAATAGLIGSPERSAPDKATGRSEVTCETLLYPELTPGNQIKLESKSINGTFKLIQVVHEGDTRGANWTSKLKLTPL